jgi:hypothetical protein
MGAIGKMQKKVEKNNTALRGDRGTIGLATQAGDPEQKGKIPPGLQRQIDDITAMAMHMIHSDDTKQSVLNMLKSHEEPEAAIPPTANYIMNRIEASANKRRTKIGNDIKLAAAQYIVTDLAILGKKAGIWESDIESEEELGNVLKDTMQTYIRKGLKDKTIDPIQLQQEAEGLLSPEQRESGISMGQEFGVPPEPTTGMAVRSYADKAVQGERSKNAELQAKLQQMQQSQQPQGQQGQQGQPEPQK